MRRGKKGWEKCRKKGTTKVLHMTTHYQKNEGTDGPDGSCGGRAAQEGIS